MEKCRDAWEMQKQKVSRLSCVLGREGLKMQDLADKSINENSLIAEPLQKIQN